MNKPSHLFLDLEPLVDQMVARLQPLVDGQVSKRAFRTPEVAEMLSISDSEVRELVASGEIHSIKVGRARLVPSSAIDEFLQRKLAESGA